MVARRALPVVGLALGAALLALRASPRGPTASLLFAAAAEDSYDSTDWRLEKYTINLRSGTALETQEWISAYLCDSKTVCPSDLGCGNYRVWCEIGSPYSSVEFGNSTFELHWVDAPNLRDLDVGASATTATDAWVARLEALDPGSSFSTFSHNKVQLFARNVSLYADRFADGGVPFLKRRSTDADGAPVAHAAASIAGRVFEVVGPLPGDGASYEAWSAEECSPAHSLAQSLAYYAAAAKSAFWREHGFGFGELLVVGLGATHHDPLSKGAKRPPREMLSTLYDHLGALAGATVDRVTASETCVYSEIAFASMPGLAFRYVANNAAGAAANATSWRGGAGRGGLHNVPSTRMRRGPMLQRKHPHFARRESFVQRRSGTSGNRPREEPPKAREKVTGSPAQARGVRRVLRGVARAKQRVLVRLGPRPRPARRPLVRRRRGRLRRARRRCAVPPRGRRARRRRARRAGRA